MTITVEGSYAAAKLWYALQCEFGFVRLPLLHLSNAGLLWLQGSLPSQLEIPSLETSQGCTKHAHTGAQEVGARHSE